MHLHLTELPLPLTDAEASSPTALPPWPIEYPRQDYEWTAASVLKAITFAIIILVAAIGNFLVLIAVFTYPKIRATTTNYFIISLAVADFLLATSVMPFAALRQFQAPFWEFGSVFCHVWSFLGTWYCSASLLSLCVISLDRYIGITRPLRYPVLITRRRAMGLVLLTWVVSFIVSGPPLVIWPEWQPDPRVCNSNLHLGHVLFVGLGSFFLPALITVCVYCRVYKVAHDYDKSLREGALSNNNNEGDGSRLRVHHGAYNAQGATTVTVATATPTATNGTAEEPESEAAAAAPSGSKHKCTPVKCVVCLLVTRFQVQKRIALRLALVGGVFLFCWAPFFTSLFVASFQQGRKELRKSTVDALKVLVWFGYTNSCLNPFIYVASSRQFRLAFRHMFCMKERLGSSLTSTPTKGNASNISE